MMTDRIEKSFLPYGRQYIDDADIEAVVSTLKSDYLTTGPVVDQFEQAISSFVNAKYTTCVNSGTAALHLAMAGLGISEGDHVVVPDITFLATANAVRLCGAEVIFADVNPKNGLMTPENLTTIFKKNKNKRIKAVVPVHLAGQTENLAEIYRIAKSYGCLVIEDACHAIGSIYIDAGSHFKIGDCRFSDATIFSFHPVKTIAMGEGGAITTNHQGLYEKARLLRSHGLNRDSSAWCYKDKGIQNNGKPNSWYYEMENIGLNYRASDINCALGLSQLKKLLQFVEKRQTLVSSYDNLLANYYPFIQPIEKTIYCKAAWHLYSVLIDFKALGITRGELMNKLREKQIGTQVHYIPVHEQPYYQNRYGNFLLPGAGEYYEKALTLPLFSQMTEEDVGYIVENIINLGELKCI